MHQDASTTVQALVDESVRDSEVLLGVLLGLVIDLQVEILEVFVALSVSLARHIQNVSHSGFNQFARFESALERPHVYSRVDLEKTDVSNGLLAVNVAGAKVDVREATASDLLIVACILHPVVVLFGPGLLLVNGSSTESGIPIHGLQL